LELKSRLEEFVLLNSELKSELSKVVDYNGIFNGIIVGQNEQTTASTMTDISAQVIHEDTEKVIKSL
jgi:hypothetical protein